MSNVLFENVMTVVSGLKNPVKEMSMKYCISHY